MANLEISKSDVYEVGLKYDYVKEKLENQKDLKDLYGQIIGFGKVEKKIINDLSGVKNYLDSVKDKSWEDIKKEGASRAFAIQIFLKSQGLYAGKIDGLYMGAGQSESKTRSAVRKFQEGWNSKHAGQKDILNKIDGWAGPDTIKKMIEVLDKELVKPETDINVILRNNEIEKEFNILLPALKNLFKEGKYEINKKDCSYKIVDKQLQKTKVPFMGVEILLADGKWKKKEGEPVKKEGEPVKKEGEKEKTEKSIPIEKPFPGSVDSRTELGLQKYLKDVYNFDDFTLTTPRFSSEGFEYLKKNFLDKNKDKLKNDFYLNSYMLYKAMDGIGTNEKLVSRVFDNYEGSFKSLVDSFGKVDGENIFECLKAEFKEKEIFDLLWNWQGNDDVVKKEISDLYNNGIYITFDMAQANPKRYHLNPNKEGGFDPENGYIWRNADKKDDLTVMVSE